MVAVLKQLYSQRFYTDLLHHYFKVIYRFVVIFGKTIIINAQEVLQLTNIAICAKN